MIKKIEEIYLFSLPIKEAEIIDFFLGSKLKDEVGKDDKCRFSFVFPLNSMHRV